MTTSTQALVNVPNRTLVLDLIEWIAARPRSYAEVMDVWRTSCPRLTIWEDAIDLGFVTRVHDASGTTVQVTAAGAALLCAERPDLPFLH